ncbi:MAG: glutathione S-transferase family protein [Steroidobacteraceae bacterium]|jgi:glutathione S-transferase
MILIGMFDSPFVRRVAVTLNLLELPFEHRNWSVGRDFERIRQFNPLGRVPTLVRPDGEALIESAAILDHLDEVAGPARALLPVSGPPRRTALRLMALATGAADKGVLQIYETAFRPEEKRHAPWVERCRLQMHSALAVLDAQAGNRDWLQGQRMTQADVTAACVFTFLSEAVSMDATRYPALGRITARCEALPAFARVKAGWFAPTGT